MISSIEKLALKHCSKIGIGCSNDDRQSNVTISGAIQAKKRNFVNPIIVGNDIRPNSNIEIRRSANPTEELINMLLNGEVDGIVRGSLVASNFMNSIKMKNEKNSKSTITARLALVQSSINNNTFLISPIGIDEGYTITEKQFIIKKGIKLLNILKIEPKISVLAAGLSPEDLGRHEFADSTIRDSELIISGFKDNFNIFSNGILIEKSLEKGSNFILCINGINGNLLYRSLVKLSSEWKSFGAMLVTNNPQFENKIIIDTSQYATLHEYRRSLIFASGFVGATY